MRIFRIRSASFACLLMCGLVVSAQTTVPVVKSYQFEESELLSGMSDNGRWGVAAGVSPDNTLISRNPKLVNLTTGVVSDLTVGCTDYFSADATDVSDSGSIVVGQYNMQPAYWNATTKSWTQLPVESGYLTGRVAAVTADGKYAVGRESDEEKWYYTPVLWDLTTNEIVPTPGLPTKDMAHADMHMMMFHGISSDGRYIVGSMSRSYLPSFDDPGGCCYFVYDRETASYNMIGFTESDTELWTPLAEGLFLINEGYMSANGKYVTGIGRVKRDVPGSEWDTEFPIAYLYNVETKEFTAYDADEDAGMVGFSVTNDGCVLASTPSTSVVRDWFVRSGKYWFGIDKVLKQRYGYDLLAKLGYGNSGSALMVSANGKRVLVMNDNTESYVLDLPDAVSTICDGIKFLSNYTVTPAEGSVISAAKQIYVAFDRKISIDSSNDARIVELLDEDGSVVENSIGFQVDNNNARQAYIRFRKGAIAEGKTYTVHIPAGCISLDGDASQVNEDIRFSYVGRTSQPVEAVSVYPENYSKLNKIDYSSSPVVVTFDCDIALSETAKASLYRNNEKEPFCSLLMAVSGKNLALYPSTLQYLFDGSEYRIGIDAGSVTDVAGNGGCYDLEITYEGSYVREIASDGNILFQNDCDNGLDSFMLYDGDHNSPASTTAGWGFTSDLPWWVARESEQSTDFAATSHSMYSPAGKSDDWMVIPQIYIPDVLCTLEFQSQSYLKSKTDVLKVYVYECGDVYNTMSADLAEAIRTNGKLVYDKVQSPGAGEETLDDEWTDNVVSLAEFAGKPVYIAFVNENEDQSAIFINNIKVLHNVDYRMTLDVEENILKQSSVAIKGRVTVDNALKTYSSVQLKLVDKAGNVVDELSASGLSLKKGDIYSFEFAKPLPLEEGAVNKYKVTANLDGDENEASGTVNNLAFKPVKRVVLEEITGKDCPNCPLGIVAIENMKKAYGDNFLPLGIHTYGSDPLGSGLSSYTNFLGLSSAPSGRIDRGEVSFPGATNADNTHVIFSNAEGDGDKLWADYVAERMNLGTIANIDVTASYDAESNTVEVPCEVRYAVSAENQFVNLLLVLVEDKVPAFGYQENKFFTYTYPELADWCKGGKYGSNYVYDYLYDDVVRGMIGFNYNGTGGYVPQNVTYDTPYTYTYSFQLPEVVNDVNNCKVVVMMIDSNSGMVINAGSAPCGDLSGVASVAGDSMSVNAAIGGVEVASANHSSVSIIAADGRVVARGEGEGTYEVSARGYQGVAVVTVMSGNQRLVKKMVIR